MGVDETGKEDCLADVVVLSRRRAGARSDVGDQSVALDDGSVFDRRLGDRKHPTRVVAHQRGRACRRRNRVGAPSERIAAKAVAPNRITRRRWVERRTSCRRVEHRWRSPGRHRLVTRLNRRRSHPGGRLKAARRRRNRTEGVDRRVTRRPVRQVLVAIPGRLSSGDVELARHEIARTIGRLKQAARDVDLAGHDRDRLRPIRRRRLSPIHFGHEGSPGGSGEHATLRVVLDLLRSIEAHPRAGNEISGVADEPDVGPIVRRSGLSSPADSGTRRPTRFQQQIRDARRPSSCPP